MVRMEGIRGVGGGKDSDDRTVGGGKKRVTEELHTQQRVDKRSLGVPRSGFHF